MAESTPYKRLTHTKKPEAPIRMKMLSCLAVMAILASCSAAEAATVSFPLSGSAKRLAHEFLAHPADSSGRVSLRLNFDDGQIMDVSAAASDARLFLEGKIGEDEFRGRVDYQPVTRGPQLIKGLCEPAKGENCKKSPECACLNSQTCNPGDGGGDRAGCADKTAPANARRVGGQYVCRWLRLECRPDGVR